MIVMFKSTPLPPTRFVFLIIYSYLTHRPSLDMVPPVNVKFQSAHFYFGSAVCLWKDRKTIINLLMESKYRRASNNYKNSCYKKHIMLRCDNKFIIY